MSDLPTTHILDFDSIAEVMYEELLLAAPQLALPYKTCLDYVFLSIDDLAVTRLEGRTIEQGRTRLALINNWFAGVTMDAGMHSVINGIANNADRLVANMLEKCVPFLTWGYIFVVRLGSAVRLEITGDRRLDEWAVLTQNGTLSLDEIMESFTNALKERAAGIIDGGISIDMDELVATIREKRK